MTLIVMINSDFILTKDTIIINHDHLRNQRSIPQ